MRNLINDQEVLIYILDADTKQLIREDFKYDRYESVMDPGDIYYSLIHGGIMLYKYQATSTGIGSITLDLDENRITELGYDFKSIAGSVIESSYNPDLGVYSFPSVAIIYMSKLK